MSEASTPTSQFLLDLLAECEEPTEEERRQRALRPEITEADYCDCEMDAGKGCGNCGWCEYCKRRVKGSVFDTHSWAHFIERRDRGEETE